MYTSNIVIAGMGQTSVGALTGKNSMQIQVEAAKLAIEDAGIDKSEIDGLINTITRTDKYLMPSLVLGEHLDIEPNYTYTSSMGGMSGIDMIVHAIMAIRQGLAEVVLVVGGENRLTGLSRDGAIEAVASIGQPEFESPYGPFAPAFYAMMAQRHQYLYGTTEEQMAEVAVAFRRHAAANPYSQMKKPITIDDVMNSKRISSPLKMLDCCLISDGGGALVIMSEQRYSKSKKPPVHIRGFGTAHVQEHLLALKDLTNIACQRSSERAFQMAGLTPEDIDVAELYDCFTITVLIELENLGFCPKGEAGDFVKNGAIQIDGRLPVNTHGGLLSHGQPGAMGGLFHVIEGVRQLRQEASPEVQVKNPEHVLVHNMGGVMSAHGTIILGR